MIISHRHKFIFIRTKKVASTAVQEVLRPFLGPKDVFTTWNKRDVRFKEHGGLHSHTGIEPLKNKYPELLEEYFVFTGIRHPMDQIISNYFQNINGKKKYRGRSFSEYIQSSALDFNYRVIVGRDKTFPSCFNYIYRYENIQEEFNEITDKIGLKKVKPLPRRKAHNRSDYRPWKEFISKKDQEYILKKIEKHLWLYRKFGYDI